ncbi:hypothetical protein C2869_09035 [Saccharobesus litoralis]|uniref:Uncharacterized protein n=1 Tax=Saccharobesus litoralis TaxID=2172099 RepID=A0A2S0VQS3_9ALTE|nr:hypothetical protein [Saccharobesus litoralis]AWB66565.1 hypothetical protein C2869_09035 [Saccharobesus litoralis]
MSLFLLTATNILCLISVICFAIASKELPLSPRVALASIPSRLYQLTGFVLLVLAASCAIRFLGWFAGSLLTLSCFCAVGYLVTLPSRMNEKANSQWL